MSVSSSSKQIDNQLQQTELLAKAKEIVATHSKKDDESLSKL